jgi:hypothetical protein
MVLEVMKSNKKEKPEMALNHLQVHPYASVFQYAWFVVMVGYLVLTKSGGNETSLFGEFLGSFFWGITAIWLATLVGPLLPMYKLKVPKDKS